MGINTLEIANRLKAAEREGRTAEEIALVFQEVFEQQLGQLITKDYLHAELDRLRSELQMLRADMEKMELRLTNALTMRMAALVAGAVAVLGGLNIFF